MLVPCLLLISTLSVDSADIDAPSPSHRTQRDLASDEDYRDPKPRYRFEYGVKDETTGDHKSHYEERDGDFVQGHYELVEPGGRTLRSVHYSSSGTGGFVATVVRTATEHDDGSIDSSQYASEGEEQRLSVCGDGSGNQLHDECETPANSVPRFPPKTITNFQTIKKTQEVTSDYNNYGNAAYYQKIYDIGGGNGGSVQNGLALPPKDDSKPYYNNSEHTSPVQSELELNKNIKYHGHKNKKSSRNMGYRNPKYKGSKISHVKVAEKNGYGENMGEYALSYGYESNEKEGKYNQDRKKRTKNYNESYYGNANPIAEKQRYIGESAGHYESGTDTAGGNQYGDDGGERSKEYEEIGKSSNEYYERDGEQSKYEYSEDNGKSTHYDAYRNGPKNEYDEYSGEINEYDGEYNGGAKEYDEEYVTGTKYYDGVYNERTKVYDEEYSRGKQGYDGKYTEGTNTYNGDDSKNIKQYGGAENGGVRENNSGTKRYIGENKKKSKLDNGEYSEKAKDNDGENNEGINQYPKKYNGKSKEYGERHRGTKLSGGNFKGKVHGYDGVYSKSIKNIGGGGGTGYQKPYNHNDEENINSNKGDISETQRPVSIKSYKGLDTVKPVKEEVYEPVVQQLKQFGDPITLNTQMQRVRKGRRQKTTGFTTRGGTYPAEDYLHYGRTPYGNKQRLIDELYSKSTAPGDSFEGGRPSRSKTQAKRDSLGQLRPNTDEWKRGKSSENSREPTTPSTTYWGFNS